MSEPIPTIMEAEASMGEWRAKTAIPDVVHTLTSAKLQQIIRMAKYTGRVKVVKEIGDFVESPGQEACRKEIMMFIYQLLNKNE